MALSEPASERALVVRGVAELLLAHHDPPQEPVGGMLIGERDASEHLHRAVSDLARAARDVRLRDRGGLAGIAGALVERGRGVQDGRPSAGRPQVHVGEDVAQRLKARDAPAELPSLGRIPAGVIEYPLGSAGRLGRRQQRARCAETLQRVLRGSAGQKRICRERRRAEPSPVHRERGVE